MTAREWSCTCGVGGWVGGWVGRRAYAVSMYLWIMCLQMLAQTSGSIRIRHVSTPPFVSFPPAHHHHHQMDEVLAGVADQIKNFACTYLVDISEVPDFNTMYELYDPCTIMFFFRCEQERVMARGEGEGEDGGDYESLKTTPKRSALRCGEKEGGGRRSGAWGSHACWLNLA